MNTPPQTPPDEAAGTPTHGPANPPARILLANGDVPIRNPGIEADVHSNSPVGAAEAIRRHTSHERWGINE